MQMGRSIAGTIIRRSVFHSFRPLWIHPAIMLLNSRKIRSISCSMWHILSNQQERRPTQHKTTTDLSNRLLLPWLVNLGAVWTLFVKSDRDWIMLDGKLISPISQLWNNIRYQWYRIFFWSLLYSSFYAAGISVDARRIVVVSVWWMATSA